MCLALSAWQGYECASALPGARLPVSLARGSLAWARCGSQWPLPNVPWALLPAGAGRAAMVPGTSYLGNVRNAPRRGFFRRREPSVPGAETPHSACPASCRQRCPLAPGWLPACAKLEHPWGSRVITPAEWGMVFPSSEGVWGPGTGAGLQGARPGDTGCHGRKAGASRTWQCPAPGAGLASSKCWGCTIPCC